MDSRSRSATRREALLPQGRMGLAFDAVSVPFAAYARLFNYPRRLRAALNLAALLRPFAWLKWRRRNVGEPCVRERMLGVVLSMLHYRNVRYPADVSIVADTATGGPLLVVVRHSLLNQLLVSHLVRRGCRISVVMSRAAWRGCAFGSEQPLDVIRTSPMLLRKVATCLRAGRIVFVAIDLGEAARGVTRIETSAGPWFVAEQPVRLALNLGVPVATVFHDVSGPKVTSHIQVIPGRNVAEVVMSCAAAFGLDTTSHPEARNENRRRTTP